MLRPSDDEEQEQYYSGKQKQHTRKNQAITLPKGVDLVDVVIGEKGPRSDSKLFEQTQGELKSVPLLHWGQSLCGSSQYHHTAEETTERDINPGSKAV